MVSVSPHVNKHLIKFPIALEPTMLRSNKNYTSSPQSTVFLKADTGADVNLMNRKTFDQHSTQPMPKEYFNPHL